MFCRTILTGSDAWIRVPCRADQTATLEQYCKQSVFHLLFFILCMFFFMFLEMFHHHPTDDLVWVFSSCEHFLCEIHCGRIMYINSALKIQGLTVCNCFECTFLLCFSSVNTKHTENLLIFWMGIFNMALAWDFLHQTCLQEMTFINN